MDIRRRARRLAVQGLCCLDVRGPGAWDVVDQFLGDSRETPQAISAARCLLKDAYQDLGDCDQLLARHAKHWGLGRLALVDRNILRLAACELRKGQIPFKVVINEALNLAEEFSTAESSRFVNGVLDSVAKELQKQAADSRQQAPSEEKATQPDSGTAEP